MTWSSRLATSFVPTSATSSPLNVWNGSKYRYRLPAAAGRPWCSQT
jgi:hypothetical protein